MQVLLNIAHCMGNLLDSGWGTVLKTFEQMYILIDKMSLEAGYCDYNQPNTIRIAL